MNAAEARRILIAQLQDRYGEGEAASIARIVLEDAFGIKNTAFSTENDVEEARLQEIVDRLKTGEPVQYVIGQALFFGQYFKVSPAVLIPRQETEELVDWILKDLKKTGLKQPVLLDIGLGSGCIALSLKVKRNDIELWGLEKSTEALDMARQNAQKLLPDHDVHFLQADALDPQVTDAVPELDILVSNPPYIPYAEQDLIPAHVMEHEPALALFVDNEDPLLFYRRIAEIAQQKLKKTGALYFECNQYNATEVVDLLQNMGFEQVELRQDISGADRMIRCCR